MSNPETHHSTAERNVETQGAAGERIAELLKNHESSAEKGSEHKHERIENARHETEAAFNREAPREQHRGGEPTASGIKRVTKAHKKLQYRHTMKLIQREMSAPARVFSKVIHAPLVEKTSDMIGGSFARPDAILAGSTAALVLVSAVYVLARTFGYRLSGFETIGSFILGWVVGIVYDYVRLMMLGRRS
jgi:hypothetical protein